MNISVFKKNICEITADIIVNAANETLLGGGGVDGAIHRASGEMLLETCKKFPIKNLKNSTVVDVGRCDVGEVIVTKSFNIDSCKYIYHTVAPILTTISYNNYQCNDEHLKLCYENCLKMARTMKQKSIVFCCLGTGFYGFPKDKAAKIAVEVARKYPTIKVIFSVIEDQDFDYYSKELN
ncbi:uncharacterized protein METZ01_LOCUS184805, partial [marine metagenome]